MYLNLLRWRLVLRSSLLLTFVLSIQFMTSQEASQQLPHGIIKIRTADYNAGTVVGPPEGFVPGQERAATINVNYTGFTAPAQTAFQYAVDIWASLITSSETITVDANFTVLGPGILGSAGASTIHRDFAGAPLAGTWYPQALANSLSGSDLSTQSDINANFSSSFTWYYGLDANPPAGQYDFVSVVLHELGHGLGFFGSADVSGGLGFIEQDGFPYIYDTFVENGSGAEILSFADGSTALANQLQGDDLFWTGIFGTLANGSANPQIYAPATWNGGSSYSHLNESSFPPGDPNSLMTFAIGSAEAIHSPGPVTLGIFQDMGWALDGGTGCVSCSTNCVSITMSDAFGDGWNGATYTINNSQGTSVASGTLAGGSAGVESICLQDGCYSITVGGGSFDSEIGWTLNGIDGGTQSGNAPETFAFSVGGVSCGGCTDPAACNYEAWAQSNDGSCCISSCVTFSMTDSFGDGWNGATYSITEYSSGFAVATGTLNDESNGVDNICLPDGCYYLTVGGGTFDSEIGWTLSGASSGNQSGGAPIAGITFNVGGAVCPGCTNAVACNYELAANSDNGSCCFENCVVFTQMDSFGDGWNGAIYTIYDESGATVTSGSMASGSVATVDLCLTDGCYAIEVGGGSFDTEISWELTGIDAGVLSGVAQGPTAFSVNSTCEGCTDNTSCNFNITDQVSTSCCYSNCYSLEVTGGSFPSEISWFVLDAFGINYGNGGGPSTTDLCLTNGCYQIQMFDSFGDSWNGGEWLLYDATGTLVNSGTHSSGLYSVATLVNVGGSVCTEGCTNPLACNFDASAVLDNNTCSFPGCTDTAACNFDPLATCDSGSCQYDSACAEGGPCTDPSGNGADFLNVYGVNVWSIDNNGSNGFAQLSAGSIFISGNNNDPDASINNQTQVSTTAAFTGNFSFDWQFYTLDGPAYDIAYYVNGVKVDLTTTLDGNSQAGSVSFFANAGDLIGFGIESTDGCCGAGYLLVSNFLYPTGTCGCLDPSACNFDSTASYSDGSCCYENCLTFDMTDGFGDGWNGNVYSIIDQDGTTVVTGTLSDGSIGQNVECLADGCYFMTVDGGAFQTEVGWTLSGVDGGPISGGAPYAGNFSINSVCEGCTDIAACNYNNVWTVDDGTCCYQNCLTIDMTDTFGDGWNGALYTVFDIDGIPVISGGLAGGSEGQDMICLADGCYSISVSGGSFDSEIGWTLNGVDAGSISGGAPSTSAFSLNSICGGCADESACNFDNWATTDDGSCCYENCVSMAMSDGFGDGWDSTAYVITDESGATVATGSLASGFNGIDDLCLSDGCYSIFVGGGAFDSEVSWTLSGVDGGSVSGGAPGSTPFSINSTCVGCTDISACNYEPTAVTDDGSCTYAPCSCLGDFNFDGTIDTLDLLFLLGQYGCSSSCAADLNGDDIVDTQDLLSFLAVFGTDCPI